MQFITRVRTLCRMKGKVLHNDIQASVNQGGPGQTGCVVTLSVTLGDIQHSRLKVTSPQTDKLASGSDRASLPPTGGQSNSKHDVTCRPEIPECLTMNLIQIIHLANSQRSLSTLSPHSFLFLPSKGVLTSARVVS